MDSKGTIFLWKIYLAAALMVVFWGSAYVGIRAALASYSPGAMALLRYLVASGVILIIYAHTLKFRRLSVKELMATAALGILGFSVYNVALNYGERTVSAGIASFLISQIPVFLTFFSMLLFGDRLSRRGWLGTALSIIGIGLMTLGESTGFALDHGVLYILIAAVAGAIFSLLQKPLLLKLHPLEFTAYAIWFGTLGMMIYLPDLWHELPKARLIDTALVIYNGIFPAAIAYLLWSFVLARFKASKAAGFLYLVPFVAIVIGLIFLHEIPDTIAIAGGILALGGAFLVTRN